MRRLLIISLVLLMSAAFFAAPAAAGKPLGVSIITVEPAPLTGSGDFTVVGEAAAYLCPSGTWEATNTVLIWQTEDRFRITQDNVFSCDTGETFVLHLRNKIVIGQGGVPGHGTWKLTDSTGFDVVPKGKGSIEVGPAGEIFEGVLRSR